MDIDFLFAILVSTIGVGIAIWFLSTKIRSKLIEVEERQASKRDED